MSKQILSDRAVFGGTRNSVHTAVNHAVGKTNMGAANWDGKKYAIIIYA